MAAPKVMVFTTLAEAESCLAAIHSISVSYWAGLGYTVSLSGGLIGKNSKTGDEMVTKAKTMRWDEIKDSPDNRFYFASLTGTRYSAGMDQLNGLFSFTEIDLPPAWEQED